MTVTYTKPKNAVKLQGISGTRKGTPVKDLKPGDVIMWNFGYTSKVVKLDPSKTGKSFTVWLDNGSLTTPRTMRAERLVVVAD